MNRILKPLAAGYKMGATLRGAAYQRGLLKTRRLKRPVVSIGNLTVGGSGKTPLVEYVADLLLRRGWTPSILTRGYRRQSREKLFAVEPAKDRAPDPRPIGDEPALLARKLPQVPIVIGANRFLAGCLAEEEFHVDVHILDDGFQHLALERDVDIVVLDVTQELLDAAMLPAGRLREPVGSLQRANIIVLSRTELGDPAPAEELARRIAPHAKVIHARTKLCELVDVHSGRIYPPGAFQGEQVYAFCGIGNPQAFFADLKAWGLFLMGKHAYRDHHRYDDADQIRMLRSSKLLPELKAFVTTEKDAQNLRGRMTRALKLPVLACVVRSELLEAAAFEAALLEKLKSPKVTV